MLEDLLLETDRHKELLAQAVAEALAKGERRVMIESVRVLLVERFGEFEDLDRTAEALAERDFVSALHLLNGAAGPDELRPDTGD